MTEEIFETRNKSEAAKVKIISYKTTAGFKRYMALYRLGEEGTAEAVQRFNDFHSVQKSVLEHLATLAVRELCKGDTKVGHEICRDIRRLQMM